MKRQRVSRACDECKSKKKQCSGTRPCTLCITRSRECLFSSGPPVPKDDSRVTKSRKRISHSSDHHRTLDHQKGERSFSSIVNEDDALKTPTAEDATSIENAGRLLQDVGGRRLVYVGDSASLSFLQSMRKLVEGSIGPSAFTKDSNRHKIVEASISSQHGYRHTYTLPDYPTAKYLVNSYFYNTASLFEIFSSADFWVQLEDTYENPLRADPQWLCQLNLVFAIGMQLRRDNLDPLSKEHEILTRLETDGVNRAESFYLAAKNLNDPAYELEDGEFPAVQLLLLMTIYMLTAAKRNTAFAYLGMAVRLAFTLGLHKEETFSIFSLEEQQTRRNLWQSLYVMDCFLSSSLGRPNAIQFESMVESLSHNVPDQPKNNKDSNLIDLVFSGKASQITGEILNRVYDRRKVSRTVAYNLSLRFSEWMNKLPAKLHWRQIPLDTSAPNLTLSRLHINLIYFHGILLLTRPFLLYEISIKLKVTQPVMPEAKQQDRSPENSFCFHGACVRSAVHTVSAVHAAFRLQALSRRDPFVIYYLFSATLIILANKFCPVYHEPSSTACLQMAATIFRSCSEVDAQARRYQTVLESFDEAIDEGEKARDATGNRNERDIFNVLFGNDSGLGQNLMTQEGPMMPSWSNDQAGMASGEAQAAGEGLNILEPELGEVVGPWTAQVEGIGDDIDFDAMWWAGGQDNFMFADVI